MPANFLEQLVAEWYEFQGYFVRRNVLVGKREKGGYECELDVVAFHPEKAHLVQVEPSMDADSWAKRELRYQRKFMAGRRHIPKLFKGLQVPTDIEQIALLGFASKATHTHLGGGKIMLVSEFLREIVQAIQRRKIASNAIHEHLPILRTLQFVSEYRDIVFAQ